VTRPDQHGDQSASPSNLHVHGEIKVGRSPGLSDQHNAERREDAAHERKKYRLQKLTLIAGVVSLVAAVVYASIAGFQWHEMHKSLIVDQRAWVSIPFPLNFPLNGTFIPATTQIMNSGKTPARQVEVDIVATVLSKGEEPNLGHFSVGYSYNHVYSGAIFPNSPIPLTIPVVRYGPNAPETIVPDEHLRQDIESGKRFISFYGRVTYYDVLGVRHWTQFCTGYGPAILESLKSCIKYNDVDTNEK